MPFRPSALIGSHSRYAGDRVNINSRTNRDGIAPSFSWALFPDWPEGAVENIVSHVIALFDALFGVGVPMYAQVNSALCVGPFRVAKRFERGSPEGHDVAVNILILVVEFIRNKSKWRFVRPKMTQHLEQGTAKCCVA
jgi:hypothetical protein